MLRAQLILSAKTERIDMSHIPPKGYEDVAFFGRNSQSCLRPEDGRAPYDAALKCRARHEGAYIIEEDDGWTVYAPIPPDETSLTSDLPPEHIEAFSKWIETPVENHVKRWESEIREGFRDSDGKWIGGSRKHGDTGQTE